MKQKDSVFILASSAIVVVLWIIFSVISRFTSPTVSDVLLSDVKPIPGTFDKATLNRLKDRQKVSPLFTQPSLSPTVTPVASPVQKPGNLTPTIKPLVNNTPTTTQPTPTILPTVGTTVPGI